MDLVEAVHMSERAALAPGDSAGLAGYVQHHGIPALLSEAQKSAGRCCAAPHRYHLRAGKPGEMLVG